MTMRFKLDGVDFLQSEMQKFGPKISRAAGDQGTRAAARMMARQLRNAAPRGDTGTLRKSIGFKYSKKTGWAKVGLQKTRGIKGSGIPFYYKTLEFGRKPYIRRGHRYEGTSAMKPFFGKTVARLAPSASQKMIDETLSALYNESRKVYQRNLLSNSRQRGRR